MAAPIFCPVCLGLSRDGRDVAEAITVTKLQELVAEGRLAVPTARTARPLAPDNYNEADAEGNLLRVLACTKCGYRVGVPVVVGHKCPSCGYVDAKVVKAGPLIQAAPTTNAEARKGILSAYSGRER